MSRGARKAMIMRDHPDLSLSRQCEVLSLSRSSLYYVAKGESPANLALMQRIDQLFLSCPFLAVARWRSSCGARGSSSVVTGCGA